MSIVDWIVLAAVIVLAALVVRRNLRKGVPCEGGGSCHGACAACRRGRSGRCPVARAAGIVGDGCGAHGGGPAGAPPPAKGG